MGFASVVVVVVVLVVAGCCCLGCAADSPRLAAQSHGHAHHASASSLLRPKRTLAYPAPSTLLLILGLGTPLQLERESAIVGAFAKMIYALPSNATADSTEADARRASRSRWSLYRSVAQLAELYGFGEGRACVLRGICEAAAAPFDAHHGLLHQLLQTFLSPSSSEEEYEQYQDREYHAAERLGGRLEDRSGCHALYPECRASLLDVFSGVRRRR